MNIKDITFAIVSIILGLFFTNFLDSLKLYLIKRKNIEIYWPYTLMSIAIFIAVLQFLWSFRFLWLQCLSTLYYSDLVNFFYLSCHGMFFYFIGIFIFPSAEDYKNETNNEQIKFSLNNFYSKRKTNIYIILMLFILETLIINLFSPKYKEIIVLQMLLKVIYSVLILSNLILLQRKNKSKNIIIVRFLLFSDLAIPVLGIILVCLYFIKFGQLNYPKL